MTDGRPRPSTVDLDVFLAEWGLPESHQRAVKRSTSTMAEIEAFYRAMTPRLAEIIEYLNQFPLHEIPTADRSLADAALAVCEVDYAVNKWHTPNLPTGIRIQDMPEKSGPYERPRVLTA